VPALAQHQHLHRTPHRHAVGQHERVHSAGDALEERHDAHPITALPELPRGGVCLGGVAHPAQQGGTPRRALPRVPGPDHPLPLVERGRGGPERGVVEREDDGRRLLEPCPLEPGERSLLGLDGAPGAGLWRVDGPALHLLHARALHGDDDGLASGIVLLHPGRERLGQRAHPLPQRGLGEVILGKQVPLCLLGQGWISASGRREQQRAR
jgi:hypothetical protein